MITVTVIPLKFCQVSSDLSSLFAVGGSGGSPDWAKGVAGIRYSYSVELRGNDGNGFILPTTSIQPQGEEMWAALRAMAREIYARTGSHRPANIRL